MRVLYHHRTRGKGAEGAHIMGVVNALRCKGHKVDILAFPGVSTEANEAADGDSNNQVNNKSISHRIALTLANFTKYIPEVLFEFSEMFYNTVVYFRLSRAINDSQPDFIYERYSLFMFCGTWIALKKGIPIIIEVNDSAIVERVRPLLLKSISKYIEKWIFKNATGLVFISNNFKSQVLKQYIDIAPYVISPNAADIESFCVDQNVRITLRKELNIDDQVVCGYVGSFAHWHGIDWFMDELAPVLSQHKHLTMLLVGDGVTCAHIESLKKLHNLHDQIILTGRVSHADVKKYISAMDYGILPDSNHYGSPMKLFEMMAMGVASVAPSYEPIEEVVSDESTGWLFEPKDKKSSVDKVVLLSYNLDEIKKVGEQASDYIKNERQWSNNADQLLELLK